MRQIAWSVRWFPQSILASFVLTAGVYAITIWESRTTQQVVRSDYFGLQDHKVTFSANTQ